MKHEAATAQLAREMDRARRALVLERLAPVFVPPLLLLSLWAAAALLGLQDRLFPLAASLAAIAALAGAAALAVRGVRRWRKPSLHEARARLAQDSGFDPSALDALDDQPARLDPAALALWEREQARAWEAAGKAAAAPARLRLDRLDRRRLRYVAAVGLVVGVAVAGFETPDRLARAFLPDPGPFLGDGPMQIEAWASPAAYTGAAPVSLSERIGKRVDTPPSVEVTVRLTGPRGAPKLVFDGGGFHRELRFTAAADGAYEAKLTLPVGGTLRVVRFHTKARWVMAPGADKPPAALFVGAPAIKDDKVVFKWQASDDFGVRELALRVQPVDPPAGLQGAEPYDTPIEGPALDPKTAEGEATLDLAAHPYAGLKVRVSVVARDALGQEGVSAGGELTLPEKIFLQPLARAAIEIRKAILWERRPYAAAKTLRPDQTPAVLARFDPLLGEQRDAILTDEFDPRIERAPAAIRRAGRMIDGLTLAPQDGYFQDLAVFAGFKAARSSLDGARDIRGGDEATAILWQTALRAEYGDAADARRALMEAQKQLSEAIARGASPDEINRLSQAVREAMNNYMQALMAEAMRNGGGDQESQEDTRQKTELSQNDLDEMMREVQRLANEGKTAEAQALLERLASLLDNLEIRLAQSGQGQGGPQGQEQGDAELNQSAEDLANAIGKQRALRDDTQRQQQQGGEQGEDLAERQRQLGEGLGKAEERAEKNGGAGKDELAKAGEEMGEAEKALRRGDYGAARGRQDEALKNLRAGADRINREIMRRQEAREGGPQDRRAGGQRDPLGRLMDGADNNGDEVTVPDSIARERVRDILDELRRRAQDTRRPDAERDYLRRLLERFTGS